MKITDIFYDDERGFTFVEILLVVGLITIITSMSSVFYSRMLNQNAVANTVDQMAGKLYKAQIYAMSGRQNANWGVHYEDRILTLYKGENYLNRDDTWDEKYSVNSTVLISGLFDINFERMSGIPNTPITITASSNNNNKTISLNSQGGITR